MFRHEKYNNSSQFQSELLLRMWCYRDLIYQLMDIEGVRAVNYVELTQDFNNLANGKSLNLTPNDNIYTYDCIVNAGAEECPVETGTDDYGVHVGGYGWQYPFPVFYTPGETAYVGEGIILPSVEPSVFELKNPNQNIRGIVK